MRYRNIAHIDFETYYDREYSLTKMPTIMYVRDPRFQTLGVAVAWNDEPSVYMSEEEFLEWAEGVDWGTTAVSAYNNSFDSCVLTQQYGIFPCYYLCPQSAARALLPIDKHNLRTVAPLLGLGEKGDALVEGAKTSTKALADYAVNDNDLARGIYKLLYPMLTPMQIDLIDQTVRQAVEPTLVLNETTLQEVYDTAVSSRDAAIKASGYTEAQLASNQQFAAIVRGLGLTVPTKISATTGEETDALSKGDDEFVEFMLTYPDYKHIWDGRLAAKSTINQTRAKRFLEIAKTGTMPMPSLFHGAHTGRPSGCDGINVLNLPRKEKSKLRLAFEAPKGYVIGVADSAGIELRGNMWYCGQTDKLEIIRGGGDLYIEEAAGQFQIPTTEVSKDQRQFGKVVQLASGYGMGGPKFRKYCAAGPMGMDPIYLTLNDAYRAVNNYRANNPKIPEMWRNLDEMIHAMTLPGLHVEKYNVTFVHEGVILPSGRQLQYPGLRQMAREDGEGSVWVYGIDKKIKFLWGGTLLENIIQALACDIIVEQLLVVRKEYRVVSWTYDEIIALIPEREADAGLQFMLDTMATSPAWAPNLPLKGEGGYDVCYSK